MPYDSTVLLPMHSHMHLHRMTCAGVCGSTVIVPDWKLLKCLLTMEQINILWYIHKREYLYVSENKRTLSVTQCKEVNLTSIMLRKGSQMEKYLLYDISKFEHYQNLPVVLKTRIVAAIAGLVTRSGDGNVLGASNILDLGAGYIVMFNLC